MSDFTPSLKPNANLKTKGKTIAFGHHIPDQTSVRIIETAFANNSYFQFERYSLVLVFLSLAESFQEKYQACLEHIEPVFSEKINRKKVYRLEGGEYVWKYFSHFITSCILSQQALEAYVNQQLSDFIPDEHAFSHFSALTKKNKAGLVEKLKKNFLRKPGVTLEDKVFQILPYYFERKFRRKINIAHHEKAIIRRVIKTRNEAIHAKPADLRTGYDFEKGRITTNKEFWDKITPVLEKTITKKLKVQFCPYESIKNFIDKIEEIRRII